jgi:UTP--glucose-1-phosphate uridylyltransferase
MKNIKKAVIPAAGSGTRMEPISRYLPKSMLPLGKKPVLEHIIDELKEASIEEIAILTKSNQAAVFKYFMHDRKVDLIIDDSESGPGGAVLNAEEFVGGDDFVVVFADAPVKGDARGEYLKELINIKNGKNAEAVVAMYRIPESEETSRGVVVFEEEEPSEEKPVRLTDNIKKPSKDEDVGRWTSACRYVLSPKIFDALKEIDPDDKGERQLTHAISHLIDEGNPIFGYPLPNTLKRYDTGNFEGYFEAFGEFIKKDWQ